MAKNFSSHEILLQTHCSPFPSKSSSNYVSAPLLTVSTFGRRRLPSKKLLVKSSSAARDEKELNESNRKPEPEPEAPSSFFKFKGSPWIKWSVGSIFFLALPTWKKIQTLQEMVSKVDATVEIVETVVEATEKLAEEAAEHLPEGSNMKKVMTEVERSSEEILEHVKAIDSIIDKVDDMLDNIKEQDKDQEHAEKGKLAEKKA